MTFAAHRNWGRHCRPFTAESREGLSVTPAALLPGLPDAALIGALAAFADIHGLRLAPPGEMLAALRQSPAETAQEIERLRWLEALVRAWDKEDG